MDTTRREFLQSLVAAFTASAAGQSIDADWFNDIRPDRFYVFADAADNLCCWGCGGEDMMSYMIGNMHRHGSRGKDGLELYIDIEAARGLSLVQYTSLDSEAECDLVIPITKKWLAELYDRHKDMKTEGNEFNTFTMISEAYLC